MLRLYSRQLQKQKLYALVTKLQKATSVSDHYIILISYVKWERYDNLDDTVAH